MQPKAKVGMVSLGCAKNLIDSEAMLGVLKQEGYVLSHEPSECDVIVVNTCGFIGPAKEESVQTILEMARYKSDGRCRKLVVAGCMVQRYADELARELPEIDALVGINDVERIHAACRLDDAVPFRADLGVPLYMYDGDVPRVQTTDRHTAYLKIAEGCDHPCSFCPIPSFRGAFRSRAPESILSEAETLAAQGVQELIVIAQDPNSYGSDLGMGRGALGPLLRQIARVDGPRWVRVLYTYPNRIDDGFVAALADEEKVCRYLDVPLQHADGGVLKRMRRGGGRKAFSKLIERVRHDVPGVTVRTTFIVGFPGETEAEFAELESFVRETEFDRFGVFTYSHEEGTTAYELRDDVPEQLKQERRERLMAIQKEISLRKNTALVGSSVDLLMEGVSPESEHLLFGRTEGQAPEIDGGVYVNDGTARPGEFVRVQITEAHPYDLVARVEGADEASDASTVS